METTTKPLSPPPARSAPIDRVRLKPDLAKTIRRFDAWWEGEVVDRPPITLGVKPSRALEWPMKDHPDEKSRWLDGEYQIERAYAILRQHDYVGDTIPTWMPNIGPELTSTLLGCDLEFSDTTSWSVPRVHDVEDWHHVAARELDFDNPYWKTIEGMTAMAIERFQGEALVGMADLHGCLDALAGCREPEMLCMDLMDNPDAVRAAMKRGTEAMRESLVRLHAMISTAGLPITTWIPFCTHARAYVPSCDFWCMLSGEMAKDLALPSVVEEMEVMDRSIFHLDGPDALRHLDLLLELPQLDAVQWVWGAGNGPAARWIEVYQRILDAGKSAQVLCVDGEDALTVLEAVGAKGVWLTLERAFDSIGEAEAFVREVERVGASA